MGVQRKTRYIKYITVTMGSTGELSPVLGITAPRGFDARRVPKYRKNNSTPLEPQSRFGDKLLEI